ncbi:MAG: TonB-dependent hemoglobin/transferrin/lactoferrin family receptor [Panacagrimonas sp.]
MPVRKRFVTCLSLSAMLVPTAHAQDTSPAPAVTLDPVTVTASKAERLSSEVPATVSVIDAERLEHELAEDLRDLVRYEPGVTVPYQGSRFGNAGISIRGLGGNRVQTKIDGVPIAEGFSIGSFSNAGRDFVDFDLIRRVEIVRGPASSLYGSDALGGVVNFITRDPADLLASGPALRTRVGYIGADETTVLSSTGAASRGNWSGLLNVVRREGHELDNAGSRGGTGVLRTRPEPLDSSGDQLLAKLLWGEAGGAPLRLTVERFEADSETEVLSLVRSVPSGPPGAPPTTITDTTGLSGDDEARRRRVSLDQKLSSVPGLDSLSWRLYHQESRTTQDTFESRTVTSVMTETFTQRERERRALFEQRVLGAETTLEKDFNLGKVPHRLVAGIEIERTQTEQSRDGLERNLTLGTETNTVGPDVFPVRDFPETRTLEYGVYAQDDIRLGRFTLVPGLRFDSYDLDPQPDATFVEDNPGIEPRKLTETQVSPKLGLIYGLSDTTSAWAQYAHGFRAPPFNDVNIGFTNLQFGYTAIPNPDLKPETSRGFELGLRGRGADFNWQLAAFRNRYEDFIESNASRGVDPVTNLLVFQSQNLGEVTIEGIEARGELGLSHDLRVRSSLAYARGEDEIADKPLNSVEPLTGVLGLAWAPKLAALELELVATATDGKSRVNDSNAAGPFFRSPGGVRLDLLAAWHPHARVDVNAGLFNLADRTLYAWFDVQTRLASDPAIERFSQPGINASVNLRVQF